MMKDRDIDGFEKLSRARLSYVINYKLIIVAVFGLGDTASNSQGQILYCAWGRSSTAEGPLGAR